MKKAAARHAPMDRIRQSSGFIESLFQGTSDGVLVLDGELRILAVNGTAAAWLRGAQRDPAGIKCHEALFASDAPCGGGPQGCPAARAFESRVAAGPVALPRRSRNGEEQHLEGRAYPVLDADGQIQAIVEILRDITADRLLAAFQEEANLRDPLTGLYNRKAFHLFLTRELKRACRQRNPLALCLLDLDAFKDFNERHGNDAGDELLASIGRLLIAQTRREVDSIFRLEADTFAAILPETDRAQSLRICERIRAASGQSGPGVGMSLAICQALEGESADGLFHRAADRLFRAKKAGGGRTLGEE
ncbi:MAG: GGDEF domain-containing protein [bacterium]